MSRDIGDTFYVRMPQQKAIGPVYSDNIIFATGTTGYRLDKPMTGSGADKASRACEASRASEASGACETSGASETSGACETSGVGEIRGAYEAVLNSKSAPACVCEYNDAYRRFVGNTYEVAKAMKSGGDTGIVSACHKKNRRHNGDGAMNIECIYTRYSAFGHLERNIINCRYH